MPRLTRTLSIVVAGAALLGVAAGAAGPAGADDGWNVGDSNVEETPSTPQTGPDGSPVTYAPPPLFYFDIVYGREEVGQEAGFDVPGCWGVIQVDQDDPLGMSYEEATAGADEWGGNGEGQGRCVDDPAEVFDIGAYILQIWQTTVYPPKPSPLEVNDGYGALTGLTSYLEIGGEVPYVINVANPIGADIVVTATPRYVISWGDGATTSTRSQGGPHPDGDLTHTYIDEGTVTIEVDAYWTGIWQAGGQGGDLPELPNPTTSELPLPVDQYQAVIDPK